MTERSIGDLSDWETWDDSGCQKLALTVAAQKGRQYACIYAAWKRATSEEKKKYYEAHLNGLEYFFERSFVGIIVDSDEMLKAIRDNVDKDLRVRKGSKKV